MPTKLFPIAIILILSNFLNGQSTPNVPHEKEDVHITLNQHFILKYAQSAEINQIMAFCDSLAVPYILKPIEKSFRLLQLSIPSDTQYGYFGMLQLPLKNQILDQLKKSKLFEHVQVSHPVSKRKVPNDLFLSKQYHFLLTKNYNVWENSIGGIDKNGDTLVVAVIDDGIDTSHEDLIPNIWSNKNEIPYNGIDDDGNGYRDDYWGWNGGDESPFIFNSQSVIDGHGTSVAGVLGAKGNNSIGIAGANWNIKIMPILCYPSDPIGDGELGVIRSMIYAYKMKKLYLDSNKTRGANIVALNMSVGMDNAFADDAPIWCSLYDSLGSVGIISVCAVTNRNVDVSVAGDIPTLCGSKYLITVSNSDDMDQHVSSGYSKTYVDLSAPGEYIYTTSPSKLGSLYKEESGTSFASPQVAGAMALLYATSCKVFLNLFRNNPDSAIQLMKSWLLSHVDTNANLMQKTLSGGRLNTLGAWQDLDSWCWKNDQFYTRTKTLSHGKVQIYPNPSTGNCFFKVNASVNCRYQILNFMGQECISGVISPLNGEHSIHLNAGNYIVIFEGQWGREQHKLIVIE